MSGFESRNAKKPISYGTKLLLLMSSSSSGIWGIFLMDLLVQSQYRNPPAGPAGRDTAIGQCTVAMILIGGRRPAGEYRPAHRQVMQAILGRLKQQLDRGSSNAFYALNQR